MDKKCPLRKIVTSYRIADGDAYNKEDDFMDCIKKECEWWSSKTVGYYNGDKQGTSLVEGCAIRLIAEKTK